MKIFTKLVLIILGQNIFVQIKAGTKEDHKIQNNILDDHSKNRDYDIDDKWPERFIENRKHHFKSVNPSEMTKGNQDDDQISSIFQDNKKNLGYDLDDSWFDKFIKSRKRDVKKGKKINCFSCLASMTNSCEDPFNKDGVYIDSECEECQKIKYVGFDGPDIWRGCPHGNDKTRWHEEYRYICNTPLCNCSNTYLYHLHLQLISTVIFLLLF